MYRVAQQSITIDTFKGRAWIDRLETALKRFREVPAERVGSVIHACAALGPMLPPEDKAVIIATFIAAEIDRIDGKTAEVDLAAHDEQMPRLIEQALQFIGYICAEVEAQEMKQATRN